MPKATIATLLGMDEILSSNSFPKPDVNGIEELMKNFEKKTPVLQKLPQFVSASDLQLIPSDKGNGLKTTVFIKDEAAIIQYIGEYTHQDFDFYGEHSWYSFDTLGGFPLNAFKRGNLARLINHSCKPNCVMKTAWFKEKGQAHSKPVAILYADGDIEPNSELVYNYNFGVPFSTKNKPCLCKSANCKSFIGKHEQRPPKPTFDCSYCDKVCSSNSKLVEHERTHTREKPFRCSVCGSAFSTASNCRTHEGKHKNPKRYLCRDISKKCKKSFLSNQSRIHHELVHHDGLRKEC